MTSFISATRRLLPRFAMAAAFGASCVATTAFAQALAAPQAARKALASPKNPNASKATRAGVAASAESYAGNPAVAAFAAEVAERRGWDRHWIERQLGHARRIPAVQQLIMPPPPDTPKDWQAYRARFVEPVRIKAGERFWQMHQRTLDRAEARWGVPSAIVVGIIGVETLYGRHMGQYRVLDALATLSFDFPPGRRDRSAYFRSELEELLALSKREHIDPASLRGSYAGAIGLPQFMPGSINRHAVDFDGDGKVDLLHSAADVIGSVANYLASHGWQRGLPTHHGVVMPADPASRNTLLAPDILPTFTPAQISALGATLDSAGQTHPGPLALVELQNGGAAPLYIAGTANFYAITRYNWSSYYAMAVIELGATLAELRTTRGGP